ncbi:hypothetical protein [Tolypothrix bouteillei]|uniref:hypothetical protein n=1 Tax=Tolypothrix bouteillei TaxID=1246981 RepID=UPI0038B459F5
MAVFRSAKLRSASLRSASLRLAPLRSVPLKSVPLRFLPLAPSLTISQTRRCLRSICVLSPIISLLLNWYW